MRDFNTGTYKNIAEKPMEYLFEINPNSHYTTSGALMQITGYMLSEIEKINKGGL